MTTKPSLRAAFARSLRLSIEGVGHHPRKTHPRKHKKAEILRFAQDDQTTVGWKGGEALVPLIKKAPRFSGGLRLSL